MEKTINLLSGAFILISATLNTFLLAPSSAGRGGRTISGKQRIGFGAAAGAQQLYSSITQARSGTATPLNSKAHITARGTFDGWVCSFRGRDGNPVNSKHIASAHTGTPGRHWPRREWGWMETMQTALTRIWPLALHSIDEGGTETLTETAYSIQHTAYSGPQDVWVCSGNGDGWKPWKQHLHTSAPSLTEEQHL